MIVSNAAAQGSRTSQQDYHAFYQPPKGLEARGTLFLLADGMGGMAAGSTASLMAVQHFRDNYYIVGNGTPRDAAIPDVLGRLVAKANQELVQTGIAQPALRGMGTTLIACAVVDNRLYYASIGDSHLYLCRRGIIRLLNEDHSVGGQVATMLAQGRLTPEEAGQYAGHAHKLVHYLGNLHFNHCDVPEAPLLLAPGDMVIMCSDGLYGTLPDGDIAATAAAAPADTAADVLVKAALDRNVPGQDNLTVQVITFQADDNAAAAPSKGWLPALRSALSAHRRLAAAIVLVVAAALAALALLSQPRTASAPKGPVAVEAAPESGDSPAQPDPPRDDVGPSTTNIFDETLKAAETPPPQPEAAAPGKHRRGVLGRKQQQPAQSRQQHRALEETGTH